MYVKSDFMHGDVRKRSLNELVPIFTKRTNRGRHVGIGGKKAIYVFMVVDLNLTCGFDGTQVLPRDGHGSNQNMQGCTLSESVVA